MTKSFTKSLNQERQAVRNANLTFLKRTIEGKYAKVEKTSIPYSRLEHEADSTEDPYFYSLG